MKKLVLILVCAVIMTVFIAFNYLLLDREKTTKSLESLKNSNESQSASIEVLGNDIKNSKDRITELNKTITTLQDDYSELAKENAELKLDFNEANRIINEKNELIDKLKIQIDTKPFESIIKKWTEGINEGQYETAYELYQKSDMGEIISLGEFSDDFKNSIKSIKLKEMTLVNDSAAAIATGEIVFDVSLEIKLIKVPTYYTYSDGLNERYFSFKYDKLTDSWNISGISSGNP